ncbi:MAG: hypothetical protein DSM106950_38945 [Stigonema ocellatum SAG 48.90 = DSM 106950]|nr:hypothetical protein [Stigonema ocellatum SAG 48.90 = DSM 106950]
MGISKLPTGSLEPDAVKIARPVHQGEVRRSNADIDSNAAIMLANPGRTYPAMV